MRDVVIPLGNGSKHKNIELRYCLRAIERHLKNVNRIYIIGENPGFTCECGVTLIPFKDDYPIPDYNIAKKLAVACNDPRISENYLMFNDDHFLLRDYDAETFPNYFQDTCEDYLKKKGSNGYGKRVLNTKDFLVERGLPTKYFDVHTPILYNKYAFMENVYQRIDFNQRFGVVLKTIYGNSLNLACTPYTDRKINAIPGPEVEILSTLAHIQPSLLKWLGKRFPETSKYEI